MLRFIGSIEVINLTNVQRIHKIWMGHFDCSFLEIISSIPQSGILIEHGEVPLYSPKILPSKDNGLFLDYLRYLCTFGRWVGWVGWLPILYTIRGIWDGCQINNAIVIFLSWFKNTILIQIVFSFWHNFFFRLTFCFSNIFAIYLFWKINNFSLVISMIFSTKQFCRNHFLDGWKRKQVFGPMF